MTESKDIKKTDSDKMEETKNREPEEADNNTIDSEKGLTDLRDDPMITMRRSKLVELLRELGYGRFLGVFSSAPSNAEENDWYVDTSATDDRFGVYDGSSRYYTYST